MDRAGHSAVPGPEVRGQDKKSALRVYRQIEIQLTTFYLLSNAADDASGAGLASSECLFTGCDARQLNCSEKNPKRPEHRAANPGDVVSGTVTAVLLAPADCRMAASGDGLA
jgi:hypothetical protein